ncbi:MAG: NnrU family protein [Gammaproteobacteria bacterium]|jgi:protein-S-isoprenylcysteine O-methyltransferase Ste14
MNTASGLLQRPGSRKPLFVMIYAWLAWGLFAITGLYLVAFLGGILVPKDIDSGRVAAWPVALLINLELLALFGLQHSVMARPWFKHWLARYVPLPAGRSTYVLASTIMIALLMWLWRPMPETIWRFEHPLAQAPMWLLFAAGWGLMGAATTWIDQSDLLGLRQARCYFRGRVYRPVPFQVRAGYRYCRHPMMSGVILGVWATPHLTVGHALLAAGLTAYILIGIHFEEREALEQLGPDYASYRASVPMLMPWPGRSVAPLS